MKFSSLLRALPSYQQATESDPEIASIAVDSRQVTSGALFVAVRGLEVDGARYIPQAIERGAVAIVSETDIPRVPGVASAIVPDSRIALAWLSAAWHNFPCRNLRVIGVTGTDGKTTTCALIENILIAAGHSVGTITTVAAHIAGTQVDTGFHTTTPDAPEVQQYLARMVAAGSEYAVIESTSHGLAQHRLDAVDFDMAVVTNITHEHLDFHHTWENYRDAKGMLFRALMGSRHKPRTRKVALLNADDNSRGVFDYLRSIECEERVIYTRSTLRAQTIAPLSYELVISAREVSHSPNGLSLIVDTPFGELNITSPLIGSYNVSNILAAVGAAIGRRIPFEPIQRGIAVTRGIVGRMERIDKGQPFSVIVDFAHTPNALENALVTARELTERRVIVVFGCAGLRDVQKRAMMGLVAGRLADVSVITAEDPRTESLDSIYAEIRRGFEQAGKHENRDYYRVDDRSEAIQFAVQEAKTGDVVMICGKGHERSMCFGTTEYPWSDQEEAEKALAEGGWRQGN
jgi:UDP-N-acetylmuramoyl-L-alanyl-D-glutamate--2,6-diaminopimelate ligase